MFSAYRTEPGSYAAVRDPLRVPTTFQAPGMMVYNINLFDEAGLAYPDTSWTWETELEALRKLTRRGAGTGPSPKLVCRSQVGLRRTTSKECGKQVGK